MAIAPGIYRHYKGALYQVVGTASHSETEELLVVYRCLYGDHSWWVRPASMFSEHVQTEAGRVPRFAFVSEAEALADWPLPV